MAACGVFATISVSLDDLGLSKKSSKKVQLYFQIHTACMCNDDHDVAKYNFLNPNHRQLTFPTMHFDLGP